MNDTCFISFASSEELASYKTLHSSITKFCKGRVDTHLYFRGDKLPRDYEGIDFTATGDSRFTRTEAFLKAFEKGYRTVVYVHRKMEFTEVPYELLGFCSDYRPGVLDQAYILWTHGIISPYLIGYRNMQACRDVLEKKSLYDIQEGVEDIYGLTRILITDCTDFPNYIREQE